MDTKVWPHRKPAGGVTAFQVDPYGSVPEAQVAEIEEALGQRLPETYRTWMKSNGGGRVHPQSFIPNTAGPGFIAEIDGIKDLPRMRGYETHSVIPTQYLIISIGSGGCLAIGIRDDNYGSVWWADLDKAEDDEIREEPSESIMVRLADNWDGFLALDLDHL